MASRIQGVSIVLTSYNYERFIGRTLASACAQRAPDLEIVVVDNASTDDSWRVIQTWASRDPRIRAYRNAENIGMIGNHIRGLELAAKERVLFLSADDYLLPGHLERLIAAHEANPEVEYFYTSYVQVDENDRFIRHLGHIGHLRGAYAGGRNEFADLLTYDCYTCTPTTLFDREAMLARGGFESEVICGDYEMYLHLAGSGARFGFLDAAGAAVRIHSGEITGKERYVATGKQLEDHLYVLERYLQAPYEKYVTGHESRIARLLQAKINNLLAYPQGAELYEPYRARVNHLSARLNESRARTLGVLQPRTPLISVIVLSGDDPNVVAHVYSQLEKQGHTNWEIVIVASGSYDATPILLDRARGRGRVVTHRGRHGTGLSLNDGVRLAEGAIITHADATVEWPDGHLQRIADALSDKRIDAVTFPVDLVIDDAGTEIARFPGFYGGTLAEDAAAVGEAVPLLSLAYRQRLLDQTGLFEEQLPFATDVDFVQRIIALGPLGVLEGMPVALRTPPSALHPSFADPQSYLGALASIYRARPTSPASAQRREAHFNRLANELRLLATQPSADRARLFPALARGLAGSPKRSGHSPKRVLVVDDRVPYDELGRGYPRARKVVEDLRDAGYDVTFYPLVEPIDTPPLNLGIPGVRILYRHGPELLGLTLDAMLDDIDLLWVSRPHNMRDVGKMLASIPRMHPPIVYDAEAVYTERDRVHAALEGNPLHPQRYAEKLESELRLTDGCAVVSAVSRDEGALIARRFAGPVEVLSFSIAPQPTPRAFAERAGLLFVGAIGEGSPNEDALLWFAEQVAPLLPGTPLLHAGVCSSAKLTAARVRFLGMVPDLRETYDNAKIFIAPTRYAAGLPQKVYEAAANGVPVIATPLIASQLGWAGEKDLLVADSPAAWVEAIERLDRDGELWQRLRENALRRVEAEVSPEAFRRTVLRIADLASSETPAATRAT